MDEKKKMLLADFALLLAATFWGMGFVAGDMAAKAFPTFWIMAVRFLGAAFWMGLLFRRAVKSSMKEDIKAGMILGGLLFLAQSETNTPVQTAAKVHPPIPHAENRSEKSAQFRKVPLPLRQKPYSADACAAQATK